MSIGIKNQTIATTDIQEPTATPATDLPDLPEEPQEVWTEEQRINFIKKYLEVNDRLGEETVARSRQRTMVAFRVGQALHHELKARGTEGAVGDWAKRNGIKGVKWTRGREALRLFWRCDTDEKRAELPNLDFTKARRKYQVRYAQFLQGRYTTKPDAPVVDRLQNALLKLTEILDAATEDDWHKAEDHLGPVSAQIDDVMGKLAEVKQVIDGIVPLSQRSKPEKSKGSRKTTAAETPEKKTSRRSKVGDDQ